MPSRDRDLAYQLQRAELIAATCQTAMSEAIEFEYTRQQKVLRGLRAATAIYDAGKAQGLLTRRKEEVLRQSAEAYVDESVRIAHRVRANLLTCARHASKEERAFADELLSLLS